MRKEVSRAFFGLAALASVAVSPAFAQEHASASLGANQTLGYGDGKLLTFTYQQQYDCVIQPNDDRNYNGIKADKDATEMLTPECQVGAPSTIDPTGANVKNTDPLYVIVPFFETNKSEQAFTPALEKALKKLLGFVPDAFKTHPGEYVQCPAPADKPASCTMHPDQLDLGPALKSLGYIKSNENVYLPLANHSHILNNATSIQSREWWQVLVVLVKDKNIWPNEAGTTGITTVAKMNAAIKAKEAIGPVATNFFLYFSSQEMAKAMAGMKMGSN